jgi:hypothetical protein
MLKGLVSYMPRTIGALAGGALAAVGVAHSKAPDPCVYVAPVSFWLQALLAVMIATVVLLVMANGDARFQRGWARL